MERQKDPIEDTNLSSIIPIKPPIRLKGEIVNHSTDLITRTRQDIRDILHGQDTKRLLMIVGPCSIHDPRIALEYAQRLVDLRSQLEDELVIVMRTYFEKPRTTVGWTGLVYDPHIKQPATLRSGFLINFKQGLS